MVRGSRRLGACGKIAVPSGTQTQNALIFALLSSARTPEYLQIDAHHAASVPRRIAYEWIASCSSALTFVTGSRMEPSRFRTGCGRG